MRIASIAFFASASLLAASLAGCNGATGSLSALPANEPQSANAMSPIAALRLPPAHGRTMGRDLIDFQAKEVVSGNYPYSYLTVYNRYGQSVQTITNDIYGPVGLWIDAQGDLYSSQYNGMRVEEYNPGQQGAAWTYSIGGHAGEVTTDAQQNVYVANYGGSTILEFAHRTNTILHSCSISSPWGVTVDAAGDVFVSSYSSGHILKYAGGLSGCSSTTLTPTFGGPQGIKMDTSGNLVVAENAASRVDILKPPYTSVSKTISVSCAYTLALNPTASLVFVGDSCDGEVLVFHYPSLVYYTTLSSGYGYGYGVAAR